MADKFSSQSLENKLDWFQNKFRPQFETMVVEPARRLVHKHCEYMPAFVWIACAIDWLSGFWWGVSTRGKSGEAYIDFVETYFPRGKYDPKGLYDSLRNGLVHMYTIKGKKYVLTDHTPVAHLRKDKSGQIVLNMEDFFADWVSAKDKYFDAVEANPELLDRVIDRYEREGFLGLVQIDIQIDT